ncbi:uncharacterized protein FA14DRAFT_161931 [Meira miltonrushii]|uniref:Hydrophobin n=1 Tax=Meira miltonrushii TaxID=1280837 RepID=A0A316V510_9BASI|nr:uncharacterized protein FA14DRAFT_161931 [Meira miltonrushii]PWN32542.1 hypothetical protein FA14DRAFT_161931 [Meira miltonrushii]
MKTTSTLLMITIISLCMLTQVLTSPAVCICKLQNVNEINHILNDLLFRLISSNDCLTKTNPLLQIQVHNVVEIRAWKPAYIRFSTNVFPPLHMMMIIVNKCTVVIAYL